MKFDPTKPLLDRSGRTMIDVDGTTTLTFAIMCARALDGKYPDEVLTAEKGIKRFVLGSKLIAATGPIDITTDEAVLIKELTAKAWAPGVYGPIHLAIDPPADEPKKSPNGHAIGAEAIA
jgi:hypothetical protein